MQRKLVVEFTKMSGAGNDFVVIDNRFYNFSDDELSYLAKTYCPRRTGIGADGVLAFARPSDGQHSFRMRYFNADGSRGTMCGNGARCLVRFARYAGVRAEDLSFESDAGIYRGYSPIDDEAPIALFVQPPKDWRKLKDLKAELPIKMQPVYYIWTGTEHVISFVSSAKDAMVEKWGPAIRHDASLAPTGANVNFVEVIDRGDEESNAQLRVRTFEKGVEGETLACGTGAMASAIAARLLDHISSSKVIVNMEGGQLGVGFELDDSKVSNLYLEGPAETIYRGTFEVDPSVLAQAN